MSFEHASPSSGDIQEKHDGSQAGDYIKKEGVKP
jgi:hypothetical protein